MSEENYNTPNSGCCGRPMQYAKEPQCNYTDACMDEYCCPKLGSIKEVEPDCTHKAVIPSVTVDSVEGITNLANCFVHVNDINTTFYIDDKHRVMITWAGPVDIPGYDMEHNPEGFRDQIVTDKEKNIAVIYDKHGKGYTFGIYESLNVEGVIDEAITNKLNEMAEDGTLEDIIATYLENAILAFDTVADMKLATNLTEGSCAQTLGFYSKADKGGATYKIRAKTGADTINEITLLSVYDNTLVAELIPENEMKTKQFGLKGDGTTDETSIISSMFSYCNSNNVRKVIFTEGTYLISDTVNLYSNSIIEGMGKGVSTIFLTPTTATENNVYLFNFQNKNNLILKNITIKGAKNIDDYSVTSTQLYFGLRVNNSSNIIIDNCEIKQFYATALSLRDSSDIMVTNSIFNSNGWNDIGMTHAISKVNIINNNFSDIGYHAINAEDGEMSEKVQDILISGNKMNTNNTTTQPVAIQFSYSALSGSGHRYMNITITNNDIYNTWIGCIVKFVKNLIISNNNFQHVGRCINNTSTNMTDPISNFIIDNNIMNCDHTLSTTNTTYCLGLEKITKSRISNNTMENSSSNNASITNATYCEIKNNQIVGASNDGLIVGGNNLMIEGNLVKTITRYGINLNNCSKVILRNNNVEDITSYGIWVTSGSYYKIEGNYIVNVGGSGIRFGTGATGNKFAQINNNFIGDFQTTPTTNYLATASVDVDYVVIENTYFLTTGISLKGSQHWGSNVTARNNDGFGTLPA